MDDLKRRIPQKRMICQPDRGGNSIERGGVTSLMNGQIIKETIVPGDLGRRKYDDPRSNEEMFRPARRVLQPHKTGADVPRVQGLRRLPEPGAGNMQEIARGRKHLPDMANRSGYDIPEPGLQMDRKNMVIRPDGGLAREVVAKERTLEVDMGVKQKVANHAGLRNGVRVANLGDKAYSHVSYSPDFYKSGGGIIPGSTFTQSRHKVPNGLAGSPQDFPLQEDGSSEGINYRKPKMTYQQKKMMGQLLDEVDSVRNLTNPTVQRSDEVPSWEDRTGMYTIKSKKQQGVDFEDS